MTNALRRLDESASDIVVADDAELERNTGLSGVAEPCGNARIGHGNHHVCGDRRFARQFLADAFARFVDIPPFDCRIRPGEIDVFEDAEALRTRLEREVGFDPVARRHDDLTRLHVAHKIGADDVKRAGLRRKHRRAVELSQHQWPNAKGIARADQFARGQCNERIGADDLLQRVHQPIDDRIVDAARHKMNDGFGVGRRLKDRAVAHQFRA